MRVKEERSLVYMVETLSLDKQVKDILKRFIICISNLKFNEEPNYDYLISLLNIH